MNKKKKGQIWVETVIYTLIGLAVIGILLAAAKPKIDEMRDKLVVEQTIESMNAIDEKIGEVYNNGPGNKRVLDVKVSRGKLVLNASNDEIYWTLDSDYEYSELDTVVPIGGNLYVLTTTGNPWEVRLSMDYSFDLRYKDSQDKKEIDEAAIPYVLNVENMGIDDVSGEIVVDLSVS